jgi:hypothetical protein
MIVNDLSPDGADLQRPAVTELNNKQQEQDIFITADRKGYVVYINGERMGEPPRHFSALLGSSIVLECRREGRLVHRKLFEVSSQNNYRCIN